LNGSSEAEEALTHVPVAELPLARFGDVLAPARWQAVSEGIERAGTLLSGRTIWNVNSTARGGGVAEMLQSLLGYARDAGVDARWIAIGGDRDFFAVTKRLHNRLHGSAGDGGPLGEDERAAYEHALGRCAAALRELVSDEDLVILHDPQTAGLIPLLRETGARIAWRSHIGSEMPGEPALEAWRFLLPYAREADVCIFSRPEYAWAGLEPERLAFIHPSIDVFSPKNGELGDEAVRAILGAAGLFGGVDPQPASFVRANGRRGRVERRVTLIEEERLGPADRVVLQVSRWDRLKDPAGVLDGFVRHVLAGTPAHLMLAGPATEGVSDDPEGPEVLAEVEAMWAGLDAATRARVHLACIPMDDADENAVIVNALQRHASVVCQKSIAEGFGLTVAEAMWKSRPVVASGVGGILDQIVHGVSGLLIGDPHDLPAFGDAVSALLGDAPRAERIGAEAHERARELFLGPDHLLQYLALFQRLLAESPAQRP
jgi:trehalose synthase